MLKTHLLLLLYCPLCPLCLLSMQQPQEVCSEEDEILTDSTLENDRSSLIHTLVLTNEDVSHKSHSLVDVRILGRSPEQVIASGSEEIYVSVKTTEKYHKSRLQLLLLTWMQTLSPHQVNIVTERGTDDEVLDIADELGFNIVKADCEASHRKPALCCKSGTEYEHFYKARESGHELSWFCHFDDDIYLNVPVLTNILEQFIPTVEKVYIGKISINKKDKLKLIDTQLQRLSRYKRTAYYFATGAAYCLSSALMTEVQPYLRGPLFEEYCEGLMLPDDMVVGAIVEAVLGFDLIDEQRFNSHLNHLKNIKHKTLHEQATVSFGEFRFKSAPEPIKNIVSVPDAVFDEDNDPTRFLSIHCHLYPHTLWCRN